MENIINSIGFFDACVCVCAGVDRNRSIYYTVINIVSVVPNRICDGRAKKK